MSVLNCRCTKEIGYYEMEVEKQTNLIHELEQKGGCAHEIKKQVQNKHFFNLIQELMHSMKYWKRQNV